MGYISACELSELLKEGLEFFLDILNSKKKQKSLLRKIVVCMTFPPFLVLSISNITYFNLLPPSLLESHYAATRNDTKTIPFNTLVSILTSLKVKELLTSLIMD